MEEEPVFSIEMAIKSEFEMWVLISSNDSLKLEIVTCFTFHFEEEILVQRERFWLCSRKWKSDEAIDTASLLFRFWVFL